MVACRPGCDQYRSEPTRYLARSARQGRQQGKQGPGRRKDPRKPPLSPLLALGRADRQVAAICPPQDGRGSVDPVVITNARPGLAGSRALVRRLRSGHAEPWPGLRSSRSRGRSASQRNGSAADGNTTQALLNGRPARTCNSRLAVHSRQCGERQGECSTRALYHEKQRRQ